MIAWKVALKTALKNNDEIKVMVLNASDFKMSVTEEILGGL